MTGNNTTANTTHADNESTLGDSSSPRTNIDARMKLLYLIVCNVLVMGLNTRSTLWPIIICLGILIACDMSRRFFLGYLAIILISFGATLLPGVPGMNNWLGVALGIVGYWVLRFTVSLSVAIWMFSTTRISEFTTAFHQMRLPNMIVIPLSVMFRFFPVVIDEMRGIVEAMKLRGYQKPGCTPYAPPNTLWYPCSRRWPGSPTSSRPQPSFAGWVRRVGQHSCLPTGLGRGMR